MAIRKASAVWKGGLKGGKGSFKLGSGARSGALEGAYSFTTRFEDEPGTNPEELIAAAHAACFSMALSAGLEKAGYSPESVSTEAKATFEKLDEGWRITKITLVTEARIPGIDEAAFMEQAEGAKAGCPISNVLNTTIELEATLLS